MTYIPRTTHNMRPESPHEDDSGTAERHDRAVRRLLGVGPERYVETYGRPPCYECGEDSHAEFDDVLESFVGTPDHLCWECAEASDELVQGDDGEWGLA